MEDQPQENNADESAVSLENILSDIHNESQQTAAAIQPINEEGMDKLI